MLVRLCRLALAGVVAVGLAAPAPAQAPAVKPGEKTGKTRLKVVVPEDDAELTIMGKPTKATGLTREFDIPPLDGGKQYEYELVAKWRPNNYTVITRRKVVPFQAGSDVTADMTRDDPNDRAEIRWVPTPDDVVARMVKMAAIRPDDVVYEPGCGDARIVITAVKAGAKKGVGVDLDPEKVNDSRASVKAAKLDGKVDIRQGDALDIKDFGEATVVFLYMGNEFNALIRPVLWKTLKPGTRVVSHRFTMGDWKPDRTEKMTGEDGDEYELHLWTVTKELKERAAAMDKGKPPAGGGKPAGK